MLRDADVLSLLLQRQPRHSLARAFYTDPGLFEVDLERIWYRDWLMTAVSAELPKTGNYVTRQIGAYSVIVVRGADGKGGRQRDEHSHRQFVLFNARLRTLRRGTRRAAPASAALSAVRLFGDHGGRLGCIDGEGLLAQHDGARMQGRTDHLSVQIHRRGDHHEVGFEFEPAVFEGHLLIAGVVTLRAGVEDLEGLFFSESTFKSAEEGVFVTDTHAEGERVAEHQHRRRAVDDRPGPGNGAGIGASISLPFVAYPNRR